MALKLLPWKEPPDGTLKYIEGHDVTKENVLPTSSLFPQIDTNCCEVLGRNRQFFVLRGGREMFPAVFPEFILLVANVFNILNVQFSKTFASPVVVLRFTFPAPAPEPLSKVTPEKRQIPETFKEIALVPFPVIFAPLDIVSGGLFVISFVLISLDGFTVVPAQVIVVVTVIVFTYVELTYVISPPAISAVTVAMSVAAVAHVPYGAVFEPADETYRVAISLQFGD